MIFRLDGVLIDLVLSRVRLFCRHLVDVLQLIGRHVLPQAVEVEVPQVGGVGPDRVELEEVAHARGAHEAARLVHGGRVDQAGEGVSVVMEPLQAQGLDFVAIAVFGAFEGIVFKRDDELLLFEARADQVDGGVAVVHLVFLRIGAAVVKVEDQVLLVGRDVDASAVGQDHVVVVAAVPGMIVDDQVVHHVGVFVAAGDAEVVSFDAVVEDACGNLDLVAGAHDVVLQGIDLVEGEGHQPVGGEEGGDGNQGGDHHQRGQDAHQRHAGRFHGQQFVALAQVAQGHDGGQQRGQRDRVGEEGARSPSHELEDDLYPQTFTHQLIHEGVDELHRE